MLKKENMCTNIWFCPPTTHQYCIFGSFVAHYVSCRVFPLFCLQLTLWRNHDVGTKSLCWSHEVTHTLTRYIGANVCDGSSTSIHHQDIPQDASSTSATFRSLYGPVLWQVKPVQASWDLAWTSWVLAEAADRRLGLHCCCYHSQEIYDLEGAQQNVLTQMIPFPPPSPGAAAARVGRLPRNEHPTHVHLHPDRPCVTLDVQQQTEIRESLHFTVCNQHLIPSCQTSSGEQEQLQTRPEVSISAG